ncbi:MAG TPA: aldo/keto reductase, partial [Actinomycetota bacterium]|nr:aldo/keto reductase [Actinomycetota bacterium]
MAVPAPSLRPLGRSGLTVTPVGFGLAATGRPAYINLGRERDLGSNRSEWAMERRSHELLDAALAAGIRYFDAARSYGYAERFLASWLRARDIAPADVTVGSNWGYRYTGGWRIDAEVHEVKDHSLDWLRRQLEETLALLGPHLDLYQIHSATLESGVLDDPAVLAELAALRDRGP